MRGSRQELYRASQTCTSTTEKLQIILLVLSASPSTFVLIQQLPCVCQPQNSTMSPISFILLVTLLVTLTSSTPTLSPRQVPLPQQYYLRTSLVDATNDTGTPKDNLYIQPYHTGAGLSDVTLTPNVSSAVAGYLNTTLDPNSGESTWITNITSLIANNETLYWDLCAVETPYGSTPYLSTLM